MTQITFVFCIAGFSLFLASRPALSHHSFAAEFDSTKPVKLTGKVTKVEWTNPHAYLYVDVQDAQTGKVTNWAIEMGSPNGLVRLGWTRNLLKVDDAVTVEGTLGRYKGNLANARSVVLNSTGQRLGAASSEGSKP
jgi:Family of unknown function (DUF6152)